MIASMVKILAGEFDGVIIQSLRWVVQIYLDSVETRPLITIKMKISLDMDSGNGIIYPHCLNKSLSSEFFVGYMDWCIPKGGHKVQLTKYCICDDKGFI